MVSVRQGGTKDIWLGLGQPLFQLLIVLKEASMGRLWLERVFHMLHLYIQARVLNKALKFMLPLTPECPVQQCH